MVAHITAADVPIAVPSNCRKYKSPNSKILFLIIVTIADSTASRGKPSGRSSLSRRSLSHYVITVMACSVSMLLYIAVASVTTR